MSTRRRHLLAVILGLIWLSQATWGADSGPQKQEALTFFGWSDQHVQVDGNGDHLLPAIDAMNALPGWPYPEAVGGAVDKPAFVFNAGDITEWPSRAAIDTYERLITKRLKFPSYEIAGNHDLGGLSPTDTVTNWLVKRHKALRYTFDKAGIRFVGLFSEYDEKLNNPAQPITKEALQYLRETLAKVPEGRPVIVATHLCFDAITNRDEFVDALGKANVILVLGGHYHKATVHNYRGFNFVQLPSPAPNGPNEFTVIRITSDRLVAIPFNYEENRWAAEKQKILDVQVKGPVQTRAQEQSTESPK
ncbi:MAG: metallophosphoesterase [Sedimentisphaerales bacterium]|nr:metallophosphoesterase [Sedimentisphaerales bacterium]